MPLRYSGNMAFSGKPFSMLTFIASPLARHIMTTLRHYIVLSFTHRTIYAPGMPQKATTSIWKMRIRHSFLCQKLSAIYRLLKTFFSVIYDLVVVMVHGVHPNSDMKKVPHS